MSESSSLKAGALPGKAARSEAGGLWDLAKVLVQALALALGVHTLLFQHFYIPSESLVPTLLKGDHVFVAKYAYGYSHFSLPSFLDRFPDAFAGRFFGSQPKRGDIVVFKLPRDGQTDYIKRLIGLPGDKVQMLKGRLYLNGAIVERQAIAPFATPGRFGKPTQAPHYLEALPGGVTHEIIELDGDDAYLDNTPIFDVPAGHYFFMGDNRDNSSDSRDPAGGVGFVPFENLVGRAEIIAFSLEDSAPAWEFWRWPWTLRADRMLHGIR